MSRKQPFKVAPPILKNSFVVLATSIGASLMMPMAGADGTEPDAKTSLATPHHPGPLELRALDYIRFREDVSEIESLVFDNENVTRTAHKRLATHDSWALSSGWMAYAALLAADTPTFADALKAELRGENDVPENTKKKKRRKKKKKKQSGMTEAELADARNRFLAKLSADPRYPRRLAGSQDAIAAVMKMARNDHLRVTALGESFKSQAYAMQKTRWGKKRIASSKTRLSEAEAYASSRPGIAMPALHSMTTEGVSQPGVTGTTATSWTPEWGHSSSSSLVQADGSHVIMDRILNLAARYAVEAVNEKVVATYAKNNKSQQCLSIVKLTLNQCIAATRTPYEEAFCLGEHALNDVAGCVGWVAAHGS